MFWSCFLRLDHRLAGLKSTLLAVTWINLPRLIHLIVVAKDPSDGERTLKLFCLEARKALPSDSGYVGEADVAEFVVNREGQSFLEA